MMIEPKIPKAYIKHQVAGRVRLKIPAKRGDEAYFETLTETFAECASITQLQSNADAGSVLLQFDETLFEDVVVFAATHGLFIVVDGEEWMANRSIASWSALGVSHVDTQLNRLSDGRVDLRSVLFLGFMGLAVHQAVRGNVMLPASTFFWRALELLNSKNENMFDKRSGNRFFD